MDFGAGLALVYWAGPGQVSLLTARGSMLALDRSICPVVLSVSRVVWCWVLIVSGLACLADRRCVVLLWTGRSARWC